MSNPLRADGYLINRSSGVDRARVLPKDGRLRVTLSSKGHLASASHRAVTHTLTPKEAIHLAARLRALAIVALAEIPETDR